LKRNAFSKELLSYSFFLDSGLSGAQLLGIEIYFSIFRQFLRVGDFGAL
jgi:hypothetical protein